MQVLLAYDGSPGAERALSTAASLDLPAGSSVTVAAAAEPVSDARRRLDGSDSAGAELDAAVREMLDAQVAEAVGRLTAAGREAVGTVLNGRPGTVLVHAAARIAADLVISWGRAGTGDDRRACCSGPSQPSSWTTPRVRSSWPGTIAVTRIVLAASTGRRLRWPPRFSWRRGRSLRGPAGPGAERRGRDGTGPVRARARGISPGSRGPRCVLQRGARGAREDRRRGRRAGFERLVVQAEAVTRSGGAADEGILAVAKESGADLIVEWARTDGQA